MAKKAASAGKIDHTEASKKGHRTNKALPKTMLKNGSWLP
jgi:hypothetical protein